MSFISPAQAVVVKTATSLAPLRYTIATESAAPHLYATCSFKPRAFDARFKVEAKAVIMRPEQFALCQQDWQAWQPAQTYYSPDAFEPLLLFSPSPLIGGSATFTIAPFGVRL